MSAAFAPSCVRSVNSSVVNNGVPEEDVYKRQLLPLYYQIDRGDAAWKAGLMMAPQGIGAALVMRLAGSLSDKRGPRYVAAFGMGVLAIGTFFYLSLIHI